MSYQKEIGRIGEQLVADWLKAKGNIIVKQNFRCDFGEIDIVAEKDGVIAFVEVKTRSGVKFGKPAEFVNGKKQARIYSASQLYVYNNDIDLQPRFDVVEVYLDRTAKYKPFKIHHIPDAFVVGYGLDFNEKYRNLPYVGILKPEAYEK